MMKAQTRNGQESGAAAFCEDVECEGQEEDFNLRQIQAPFRRGAMAAANQALP
jgi:hypothetical protein